MSANRRRTLAPSRNQGARLWHSPRSCIFFGHTASTSNAPSVYTAPALSSSPAECARFSSMKLKLDGYRVQVHLHDGRVSLYTRTGLDWTTRFPTIAADVARLPAGKRRKSPSYASCRKLNRTACR